MSKYQLTEIEKIDLACAIGYLALVVHFEISQEDAEVKRYNNMADRHLRLAGLPTLTELKRHEDMVAI